MLYGFFIIRTYLCILAQLKETAINPLVEGDEVEFEVTQGPKGEQASNVTKA